MTIVTITTSDYSNAVIAASKWRHLANERTFARMKVTDTHSTGSSTATDCIKCSLITKDCNPGTNFQSRNFGTEKPFAIPGLRESEIAITSHSTAQSRYFQI